MNEEEVEAPPDPPGEPVEASWPWRARRVLARFGPRAVPALLEALRTAQDPAVRRFAAESLGRLGAGATVAAGALRQAARGDGDPAVRAAALAALGVLEPRDP